MSDLMLRSRILRLAHSNPSLRADLLPLLTDKAASAGGTVTLDTRPEQGYIRMTVRRSVPFGTVSGVVAAADAFRQDVSQLAAKVLFVRMDSHVGEVKVGGWQQGLFLEAYVRVEGPPFEDAEVVAAIKRSGFRLGR